MTSLTQTTDLFANLRRTVHPDEFPVSISELKSSVLQIEDDEQNGWIEKCIKAATAKVENDTKRGFVTQTWKHYLDSFCDNVILLRRCPVIAVTSITYVDNDGATQTVSSSDYQVDVASEPGRVYPAYGESWPSVRSSSLSPIVVTFTVGYGAASAEHYELDLARQAISILAAKLFEGCQEPGMAYDALIDGLRWE